MSLHSLQILDKFFSKRRTIRVTGKNGDFFDFLVRLWQLVRLLVVDHL